jgi:hypothetical protein
MGTACERAAQPAVVEPSAETAGIQLSETWDYLPASADAASATGSVSIFPGVSAEGPTRTLKAANGLTLEAALIGEVSAAQMIGPGDVAGLMEASRAARPTLYRLTAQTPSRGGISPCGANTATHILWHEPEMIEGRFVTIAVLNGAPGEPGASACQVLRYARTGGN